MNTGDYLLEYGKDQDPVLLTEEAQYTYRDLRQAVHCLQQALDNSNIQPGDRVGILAQNSFFWVAAYLATLKQEAVAVPIATTNSADEIHEMVRWAGCKACFAQNRFSSRFNGFVGSQFVIFEDVVEDFGTRFSSDVASEVWPALPALGRHLQVLDLHPDAPSSLAALLFTSGTTARPRAVAISHRNVQANTDSIIRILALDASERIMVVLPFSYCFGTSLLHTHLRVGGSLVISNKFTFPEKVLDLMEATACTGFAGVPSIYQTLLRSTTFPRRQFPILRKLQQAGGKLTAGLVEELANAAGQAQVFIMYGQTEATARLSYLPPEFLKSKPGSVGIAIPGVSLQVLHEDGQPVKPGEVGEIVARGENISQGYFNDPEDTAEKFPGGSLLTGDLATVDEDGFIYIVDRKSDIIKSYGYRISSQRVEACILELPEVITVAAVGEEDEIAGEALVVYLTLKPGAKITAMDVQAHCLHRLGRYMVPERVLILPVMPLNASGKVSKSQLRKRASASKSTEG